MNRHKIEDENTEKNSNKYKLYINIKIFYEA